MPFGFLLRRHYLIALFLHCVVALTVFFVSLPVAEPIRDWGPTFFINCGSQAYQNCFLTTEFSLTYQNFEE